MEKKIILTGGGSAGHVTPNLALLPQLLAEGIEVHYIGTADGIERTILSERKDVTYHIISSGKLRRYFSWKNFTDPFRVMRGLFQARRVMRRDHLSRPQALRRMASQLPLAEKRRRADHVIDTSGNFRSTNRRVRGLLRNTQRRNYFE